MALSLALAVGSIIGEFGQDHDHRPVGTNIP